MSRHLGDAHFFRNVLPTEESMGCFGGFATYIAIDARTDLPAVYFADSHELCGVQTYLLQNPCLGIPPTENEVGVFRDEIIYLSFETERSDLVVVYFADSHAVCFSHTLLLRDPQKYLQLFTRMVSMNTSSKMFAPRMEKLAQVYLKKS